METADVAALAARIARSASFARSAMRTLSTDKNRAKFAYGKALLDVSAGNPKRLYPFLADWVELLSHANAIIQWTAIRVIADLARVDVGHRIDGILKAYLALIDGPVMITAANTIAGAARIALARPDLTDRIVVRILRVESARYQTEECRNVAIGHAITALESLGAGVTMRRDVAEFVRRQTRNTRPATRNKAARLVKKMARVRRA